MYASDKQHLVIRIMRFSAKLESKIRITSDCSCGYSFICRLSPAIMANGNIYNGFKIIGATLTAFVKTSTLSALQYFGIGIEFRNLYILLNSVITSYLKN